MTTPILNLSPRALGRPSPTLAIHELSARLAEQGKTIFRLGFGQSPFPVPQRVVDALREHASEKAYLPVRGLVALRRAISAHVAKTMHIEREADDIIVGPGTKELMFLLQLVYGGELLLPSPSWVSYAPQAHLAGQEVVWLPTYAADGWRLRPEVLDEACAEDARPRLLVLNSPSNPTGTALDEDELAALAEVARKHRVLVLSDEIYGELHHDGAHTSLAAHYPEGTVVSGGLSKWCGAGGWRLGWLALPRELSVLNQALAAAASETYSSAPAPIQFAAIVAYEDHPEIRTYLADARRILSALGDTVAKLLHGYVTPPHGGFYVFADFSPMTGGLAERGIHTGEELARALLSETGVAVLPGEAFGRPPEELSCRVAYVDFDGAAALDAARDVAGPLGRDFVGRHCPNVIEGLERLRDFVRR